MKYEVREARETDLPYLAQNLRSADVRELYAQHGHVRIAPLLRLSWEHSDECLVGLDDEGKPQMIWGYIKMSERSAMIWAVGTPVITSRYVFPLMREAKASLRRWFAENPDLHFMFNFTHSANTTHQRWLKWCGAYLLPDAPYGVTGDTFKPFIIRRYADV